MGQNLDSHINAFRPRGIVVAVATTLGIALSARANVAVPSSGVVEPRPAGREVERLSAEAADAAPVLVPGAHEWVLLHGKHWQIKSGPGEDPSVTDEREGTRGRCPAGMVEVEGKMKVHALFDELQLQACTTWIDRKWPERCAEYDRTLWLSISKDLPTKDVHVCMDRFEFPNRKDVFPIIVVSWFEARDACKAEGKRLCTEDEWTYACEGDEAMPYPNGYSREGAGCVNDRAWRQFDDQALIPRNGAKARAELERLWQGERSGSRATCKSRAGVYDMTGNVDEWTKSSVPGERPSVLKGGYWGPVRTRCRPATKAHNEFHIFYQQGFRCCADPEP
jgi:hypothetical protein